MINKLKIGVAKFIANKFLANEMNAIKEQFHKEEFTKVHEEMEYYQSVIKQLQEDKLQMSQVKFKEQIQQQTKHIQQDNSVNLEKDNNIDNPFKDYL